MNGQTTFCTLSVCATLVLCVSMVTDAGSLSVPPGPVTGTMKTLDQVEPRIPIGPDTTPGDSGSVYKITQSGSYYLAGPLTGEAGKHGIDIANTDVTLDLNGFECTGVTDSLDGIHVSAPIGYGITIRNGTIESWGQDGVGARFAVGVRVEGVSVAQVQGYGVRVGDNAIVSDCSVSYGVDHGFAVGDAGVVDRCRADGIFADTGMGAGFDLGEGCAATSCCATDCEVIGFLMDNDCTVQSCSATGCSTGFSGGKATMHGCAARGNSAIGILMIGGIIEGCTASENAPYGIFAAGSCMVVDCRAESNGENGILVESGVISRCTAQSNSVNGIIAVDGARIESCASNLNGGSGIVADHACSIAGNVCKSNTAHGISVTGGDNRIEGNVVVGNDAGIEATGLRNVVIRNHAHNNNDDYGQIVGGNVVGTIITTEAAMNSATNDAGNLSF